MVVLYAKLSILCKTNLLNKINCEEKDCPNIDAYPTWINKKKIENVATSDE